jgi:15-cis-phytoene desaturase
MRQKVVIIGGGIGGLTAAHELVERDFDVTVYERRERCGGKAASSRLEALPGDAIGRPAEHGFRFFPGWYRHLPDTMARIPFERLGGHHVSDRLVPCDDNRMLRYEGAPVPVILHPPRSADQAQSLLEFMRGMQEMGLSVGEAGQFLALLAGFLRLSPAKRQELDAVSWLDFVGVKDRSDAFRAMMLASTRTLLAAKADQASAFTIASMAIRTLFGAPLDRDRTLDGPTSETWIDPWVRYLEGAGVVFKYGRELDSIVFDGQGPRIKALTFFDAREAVKNRCLRARARNETLVGEQARRLVDARPDDAARQLEARRATPTEPVEADHFVFALPAEQMAYYVNRSSMLTHYDPGLRRIVALSSSMDWMAGIQFYLRSPLEAPRGHIVCMDSEWALTAIEQRRFWRDVSLPTWMQAVLSVDISAWSRPGRFVPKEAYRCTRDEIAREVWGQLAESFNRSARKEIFREALLVNGTLDARSYHLDNDIVEIYDRKKQGAYLRAQSARLSAEELLASASTDTPFAFGDRLQVNSEPLLINRPGTLALRPEAATGVKNMFLAADYVRTATNLACMEAANEAGRLAVNAILQASGAREKPCETWTFETKDFVGRGLEWAAGIERAPGVRQGIALAGNAAKVFSDALARARDSISSRRTP